MAQQPIRWDNMASRGGGGNPADFMRMSQAGMAAAFDNVNGVLKQNTDITDQNFKQGTVNNTRDFYAAINAPQTSEDFGAQRAALQAQMKGYGAQIAPEAMAALDGRQAILQSRGLTSMDYSNKLLDQTNAPLLEEYRTASPARQAEIVAKNPGMRGLGAVVQDTQKFGWEGEKAAAARLLAPLTRDQTLAQTAQANAQTAAIPVDQNIKAQAGNIASLDKFNAMLVEANTKLGKTNKSWVGSDDGQKALVDGIVKSTPDKATASALLEQISAVIQSNPKYANLPATVVEQIALANKGGIGTGNWWDSNNKGKMTAAMDKALAANGDSEKDVQTQRSVLTAQIGQIRSQIDAAETRAFPELAAARLAGSAKAVDAAPAKANGLVGVASPEGSPAPAAVQAPPVNALMQEQAQLEMAEKRVGVRKEFTKEVSSYLKSESSGDRKALDAAGAFSQSAALSLGNAFNDIITLPVRGVGGAINSALRLPNAYGANIPYIPDEGGVLSSMTPYSDRQNAINNRDINVTDVKAARVAFEAKIKEAVAKKAK